MEEIISVDNLDERICDFYNLEYGNEETFREYIFNSENEFEIAHMNVDAMTDEYLNKYLDFLDELWDK